MITPERPLAAAINHLLSRQPQLCKVLLPHAGKSARIAVGTLQLDLAVANDGLLQASTQAEPHVTIRIKPADLPQILANMDRAFSYVGLSGDAELAKAISEVAQGLHWEAEEDLAPFVGDIAAVRIAQAARATVQGVRSGGRKLVEQIAEYLLEENPTLLYRKVGEDFAAQVAALRDDVERLGKRIGLLEIRFGAGASLSPGKSTSSNTSTNTNTTTNTTTSSGTSPSAGSTQ
jgi:ubiquinone biosynthesis accessory factor UbiJ